MCKDVQNCQSFSTREPFSWQLTRRFAPRSLLRRWGKFFTGSGGKKTPFPKRQKITPKISTVRLSPGKKKRGKKKPPFLDGKKKNPRFGFFFLPFANDIPCWEKAGAYGIKKLKIHIYSVIIDLFAYNAYFLPVLRSLVEKMWDFYSKKIEKWIFWVGGIRKMGVFFCPPGTTSKRQNARKCELLGLACFPVLLSVFLVFALRAGGVRKMGGFFCPPGTTSKS